MSNLLTAKGSACSHEIGAPQDAGLIFSGSDSGTATRIKQMSSIAMAEARTTTRLSPYTWLRYAPMAGLITRLAANVAETFWRKNRDLNTKQSGKKRDDDELMGYTYHAVSHTALMLLGDVSHISEYNWEGNSKHSRYRDNGKVPPKTQQEL